MLRRRFVQAGASLALLGSALQADAATTTTWNPSDKSSNIVLSNGNLTATLTSAAQGAVRSTTSIASGKVYFEATLTQTSTASAANYSIGIVTQSYVLNVATGIGGDLNSIGVYPLFQMQTYLNNTVFDQGNAQDVTADVLRFAVDLTRKLFWWSSTKMIAQGNAWNNRTIANSNPATGIGGDSMAGMSSGPYFVAYCDGFMPSACTANFGSSAFAGTIPAGFTAWNSVGLQCYRVERTAIYASAGIPAVPAGTGNPGGTGDVVRAVAALAPAEPARPLRRRF